MRVTSKGQVTIPKAIREEFGLMPGTEVEFVTRGGEVRVRCHAAVAGLRLLTRDTARYRSYFPTVELIAPE